MTGRMPVVTSIAISDSSSDRVPIVEPTTDNWRKKTRLRSAGGFGPLVAPQTTIVPPGARDFSAAGPVVSSLRKTRRTRDERPSAAENRAPSCLPCCSRRRSRPSAQLTTGTVTGTVKDAQGGVDPRRDGHAHQRDARHADRPRSSPTRPATSCSPTSRADTYTIEVEMPSFKTLKRTGIAVSPGDRVGARHPHDRGRRRHRDRQRQGRGAADPDARAASAPSRSRPRRSRTCRSPTAASLRSRRWRPASRTATRSSALGSIGGSDATS